MTSRASCGRQTAWLPVFATGECLPQLCCWRSCSSRACSRAVYVRREMRLTTGEERKRLALETCKAVGLVMDKLEERNEMSETVRAAGLASSYTCQRWQAYRLTVCHRRSRSSVRQPTAMRATCSCFSRRALTWRRRKKTRLASPRSIRR